MQFPSAHMKNSSPYMEIPPPQPKKKALPHQPKAQRHPPHHDVKTRSSKVAVLHKVPLATHQPFASLLSLDRNKKKPMKLAKKTEYKQHPRPIPHADASPTSPQSSTPEIVNFENFSEKSSYMIKLKTKWHTLFCYIQLAEKSLKNKIDIVFMEFQSNINYLSITLQNLEDIFVNYSYILHFSKKAILELRGLASQEKTYNELESVAHNFINKINLFYEKIDQLIELYKYKRSQRAISLFIKELDSFNKDMDESYKMVTGELSENSSNILKEIENKENVIAKDKEKEQEEAAKSLKQTDYVEEGIFSMDE